MVKKLLIALGLLLQHHIQIALPSAYMVNDIAVAIEKGDITQTRAQIIVNAANDGLRGGAGVCGAIFKAAGWDQLQKACDVFGGCKTGSAVITPSFNLEQNGITHIIHAVGPDCRIIKDKTEQDKLLRSTYKKSLDLAEKNKAQSIAFPFISSAIFAFPKDRAAQIALDTINEWAKKHRTSSIKKIHFVLFSDDDTTLFRDKAASYLANTTR